MEILLFYITHPHRLLLKHHQGVTVSREVKHPGTVLTCTFTDDVHHILHIKFKLLWYSIQVG